MTTSANGLAAPSTSAGCQWDVSYADCPGDDPYPPEDETPEDAARREMFEQVAVDYLNAWTLNQFGLCPVSLRPCRDDCPPGSYTSTFWGRGPYPDGQAGGWQPVLIGGQWFNIRCGVCGTSRCSCGHGDVIELPGPVHSIEQITVDGTVLDPSSYRVDNYRLLVRTDGDTWPRCQDLDDPITEEGTWQVDYTRGRPVPTGGQLAAGRLAFELEKAYCGDKTCALPQRVQSITRQGVSMAVLDSFEDVQEGRTGIWPIDAWIASVTQPPSRGRVYSPDVRRPRERVQTWPAPTHAQTVVRQ